MLFMNSFQTYKLRLILALMVLYYKLSEQMLHITFGIASGGQIIRQSLRGYLLVGYNRLALLQSEKLTNVKIMGILYFR